MFSLLKYYQVCFSHFSDNSQVKVNAEAWFQNSSNISSGSLKAMIENGTMTFSQIEVKGKRDS